MRKVFQKQVGVSWPKDFKHEKSVILVVVVVLVLMMMLRKMPKKQTRH